MEVFPTKRDKRQIDLTSGKKVSFFQTHKIANEKRFKFTKD